MPSFGPDSGISKLFCQRATQQFEGRTSYVMWLFRGMLHSTKSTNFSWRCFFSLSTKWLRGTDLSRWP